MDSRKIDLWAMDEVHFQQHGSRCRMWIPPEEKNPVLKHHPTRKSVGYFGAVRLRDGKMLWKREDDRFNAQSTWDFLKTIEAFSRKSGRKAVVIADNARYYHAKLHQDWRKKVKKRMVLDFLPPYSPDLNPIERVWKLIRRLRVHNQYFPALESVREAVEDQMQQWNRPNKTLQKRCAI